MQYSPKLKKAMEEIKQILKKHDIGAFVVIHDPANGGFSEYLNYISPSYSCASLHEGGIRIRVNRAEMGEAKAQQLADATYNMVTHLADMVGKHALLYMDMQEMLKEKWGGEEGEGRDTSHEHQNN